MRLLRRARRYRSFCDPGCEGGEPRPLMYRANGNELSDIRTVSGEFLLSLLKYWRLYGWDCLVRTGRSFLN